ncbi:MAG: hypothetical protein LBQ76_02370 [Candidatus Fibromonas sp.]|jgi:hypothetical protein|nr:hypothetical protein [Candidatus Fibromonas sp.]
MKKLLFFIALFSSASLWAAERKISMQISPITFINVYANDTDSSDDGYLFTSDIELQYAINERYNVSIVNTFRSEKFMYSYSESVDGLDDEKYCKRTQYIFKPALIYRPYGGWLRGMFLSLYPIIGQEYVSTEEFDDVYTHAGFGNLMGYQWIPRKIGLTQQFGIGVSKSWIFSSKGNKAKYRRIDSSEFGFDFRLVYRVGWSF